MRIIITHDYVIDAFTIEQNILQAINERDNSVALDFLSGACHTVDQIENFPRHEYGVDDDVYTDTEWYNVECDRREVVSVFRAELANSDQLGTIQTAEQTADDARRLLAALVGATSESQYFAAVAARLAFSTIEYDRQASRAFRAEQQKLQAEIMTDCDDDIVVVDASSC